MREKKSNTGEFKKILLYTDEAKKKRLTDTYILNVEQINTFISECEILLKKQLTKKEINSVLNNPLEYSETVKESIKKSFQFPNATDDFNMSALGLSFDKLETALNVLVHDSSKKYLVDGGKVIAEPKELNNIQEQCKIYSRNEKQNKALEIAKSIKESANKLIDLNITFLDSQNNYPKATGQLLLVNQYDTSKLLINFHRILELN